jgi:hypothetical protein
MDPTPPLGRGQPCCPEAKRLHQIPVTKLAQAGRSRRSEGDHEQAWAGTMASPEAELEDQEGVAPALPWRDTRRQGPAVSWQTGL